MRYLYFGKSLLLEATSIPTKYVSLKVCFSLKSLNLNLNLDLNFRFYSKGILMLTLKWNMLSHFVFYLPKYHSHFLGTTNGAKQCRTSVLSRSRLLVSTGCSSVGRDVVSDIRDPRIESSLLFVNRFNQICLCFTLISLKYFNWI